MPDNTNEPVLPDPAALHEDIGRVHEQLKDLQTKLWPRPAVERTR